LPVKPSIRIPLLGRDIAERCSSRDRPPNFESLDHIQQGLNVPRAAWDAGANGELILAFGGEGRNFSRGGAAESSQEQTWSMTLGPQPTLPTVFDSANVEGGGSETRYSPSV
jgi:hypothetical protein